ncbi:hypothetical protein [Actinomadura rifamycini]|uniref:hypothetical protein n=1 Tax=Actinomadura rifamycini TaxID=31962 RepID=UPI0003FEFB50|nr:hypothetical protein [Actinomadura rifamycini]
MGIHDTAVDRLLIDISDLSLRQLRDADLEGGALEEALLELLDPTLGEAAAAGFDSFVETAKPAALPG